MSGIHPHPKTFDGLIDDIAIYNRALTPNEILQTFNPAIGDYNDNGGVDAADYSVWRDNLGSMTFLPNDATPGNVTQEDYDVWKLNFGNTAAGSSALSIAAVPEPATAIMLMLGMAAMLFRRRAVLS